MTVTPSSVATLDIPAAELSRFCEFFYSKTGIRLDDKRRYFIDKRVLDRMAATASRDFDAYFIGLRTDTSGKELQALINEMTVNETYFFREDYQFECLTRHMLDEIAGRKARGERIRVWSIPCSTGEEPYSLAITILENWPRADEFEIEILASDIDSRVLAAARQGIYEERSLARVPAAQRAKYFNPIRPRGWQVIAGLRESLDFATINIVDPTHMARMRGFDVIFCRNLLIYFDDLSRRRTAELLFEALLPGGFICLGHSESMSRMSSLFLPRKFPQALVHQRPLR